MWTREALALAGPASPVEAIPRLLQVRHLPASSVRATFSQSRRTLATPCAVLISIGHSEQMKITKIEDRLESLMV